MLYEMQTDVNLKRQVYVHLHFYQNASVVVIASFV